MHSAALRGGAFAVSTRPSRPTSVDSRRSLRRSNAIPALVSCLLGDVPNSVRNRSNQRVWSLPEMAASAPNAPRSPGMRVHRPPHHPVDRPGECPGAHSFPDVDYQLRWPRSLFKQETSSAATAPSIADVPDPLREHHRCGALGAVVDRHRLGPCRPRRQPACTGGTTLVSHLLHHADLGGSNDACDLSAGGPPCSSRLRCASAVPPRISPCLQNRTELGCLGNSPDPSLNDQAKKTSRRSAQSSRRTSRQ